MKVRLTIIFVLLIICQTSIFAQERAYFQQRLEYKIHITLNDSLHEAWGTDTVFYFNNSPDTLRFIYFHLWPNATKNNETALAKELLRNRDLRLFNAKPEQRGYIDNLDFYVDGQKVDWQYDSAHIDIAKIHLKTPILPGAQVCISTPFRIKIPSAHITRFGHIDQAYYFTQWYPKPAVYDQYGWHPMPYLNKGEYYAEFAKFDVYITLPKNYVVASTGYLVNNPDEEKWLLDKVQQTEQIQEFDVNDNNFPPSDKEWKTLHFRRDSVHDFAWFADKRYHVLCDTKTLPFSNRIITTWVYFTNKNALYWKYALLFLRYATSFYCHLVGDYPYDRIAAVDVTSARGGGMEYPCITSIGNAYDLRGFENVIMHEVGHNWFYGVLGSNERRFPFMDEGFNTFYDNYYQFYKIGKGVAADTLSFLKTLKNIYNLSINYNSYYTVLFLTRRNLHQACNLHSMDYDKQNYGIFTYTFPAYQIKHLENYLGTFWFINVMRKYYQLWSFKHPYPEDLQKVFEQYAPKDCDWFFEDAISTRKTCDYTFGKVKYKNGFYKMVLKNRGQAAVPFALGGYKDNKLMDIIWVDGFVRKTRINIESEKMDVWKIDATNTLFDINRYNNSIKPHAVLKRWKPLQPKLINLVEKPQKNEFGILPAVGWNYHNGLLTGVVFYSNPLYPRKFDYIVMPLWSEKTSQIAGYTNIGYTFHLPGYAHTLRAGIAASRYAYSNYQRDLFYQKLRFDLLWHLPKNAVSTVFQQLKYSLHYIEKKELQIVPFYAGYKTNGYGITTYPVHVLEYKLHQMRIFNPYIIKPKLELMDRELKFSLESKMRVTYQKPNKYLEIRGFYGAFLTYNNKYFVDNRFRLSGWNGTDDYLFSHYFVARDVANNNFFSQQFVNNDGGFKIYTYYGQTGNWLAAVNLSTTLPGKIPLMLYADLGTYCLIKKYSQFNESVYYDAGVSWPLIKGICEVFFPVLQSRDLTENSNYITNNNYWQKIRFSLYLERLNPADFVNKKILNRGDFE